MGEDHGRTNNANGWLFEPTFNRSIKLRHADPRITSNAGALLLREVDHRLGLTADLATQLTDPRRADRIRYTQVELLRQHIYAAALGYAHQDDADTLAHDVAMKLAVWDRTSKQVADERLASQPSDWRLIVDVARAAGVLWDRLLDRVRRWWRDEAWGCASPRPRRWVSPPRHSHMSLVLRE